MSDKPETLSEILADMRNPPHKWEGFSRADLARLADRIEAAAERERDEDRQLAAIAESDEAFARCARCDRPERAPGNAAALREALERIVGWCEGCHADTCEKVCRPGLTSESIHAALAALAAPARNCDRFQTADEAVAGFADFLRALENAHGIYSECPDKPALAAAAALAWLFDTPRSSAQ